MFKLHHYVAQKSQKQPTRCWRPGEDLIDGYFSRYSFTNITVA